MKQADKRKPVRYNSVYRHGVDRKRRVQIPAKWRPSLAGTELTLILWPKHQAGVCLRVMAPQEMAELVEMLKAMPSSDPNKTILKRIIGSESAQVTLDRVGRICLPEAMAQAAQIKDEVVFVGLLDRFEIWNPERFDKVCSLDAALAPEAFKLME